METLDIARWQFAITTIYHFLLVPITIGLSGLVALMQTQWVRTGDERYLRITSFWGKLLLINFALGVATGNSSARPSSLMRRPDPRNGPYIGGNPC